MTKKQRKAAYKKARQIALSIITKLINAVINGCKGLIGAFGDWLTELLAAMSDQDITQQSGNLLQKITRRLGELGASLRSLLSDSATAAWGAGLELLKNPMVAAGWGLVTNALSAVNRRVLEPITEFIDNRAADVVTKLGQAIKSKILLFVADGIDRAQLIGDLMGAIATRGISRITTIAKTELSRIVQTANQLAREAIAPHFPPLKKQWLHGHPKMPRPTHVAADGQIRDVLAPFDIGGVMMMHPHDPTAPLSEVINCECSAVDYIDWARA